MRRFMTECRNEAEKQELRDWMLEHMYYQTLAIHNKVADTMEMVKEIKGNVNYLMASDSERQYMNCDGTANLNAITELCDKVDKMMEGISREEL